jgi:protein-disulfide isomerase
MSRKSKRNRPQPSPGSPQAEASSSGRRLGGLGIVIGSAVLIVAAFALGAYLFTSKGTQSGSSTGTAATSALASAHSPPLGDASAKVHVVEFLDPACETCAQFFPLVKQLMAENPGRIRLSVRHVAFHEGADYAVRVLEASRLQDKYWQTLEALLSSQSLWAPHHTVKAELVLLAVAGVGLDVQRLQGDMNSPDVAERIQQDRNDAMTLKVTATPEYFVNGRQLPSFGQQQLLTLVREELQAAY